MHFPSGKKILSVFSNVMMILAVSGCLAPPSIAASPASSAIAESTVSQQLIIKLRPNTLTCDFVGIAKLSSAIQVPLEYLRPMSGDGCVIRQLANHSNDLLRGQELLRQHPAVEWVEQDAIKKAL